VEKRKLEATAIELRNELEAVKCDLECMQTVRKELEEEKHRLGGTNQRLQSSLDDLEVEKSKILNLLSHHHQEKEALSKENLSLSKKAGELTVNLSKIEDQTKALQDEKQAVESRLKRNEARAALLAKEKEFYSNHARELMSSLRDLTVEKEMTEAELKDEIIARMAAERQLQTAEQALERLELALRLSGTRMCDELKDEIMPDVRRLRSFFENCAEEAALDANRPMIMRNAVYARKSFLKKCKSKLKKTMRFKESNGFHHRIETITEVPEKEGN